MRAVVLILAAMAASSCTRTDPLFCDENTPCTDPARPFCDLTGEFPASDGVGKTCIADPNAGVDGGLDDSDASQLGCTGDTDCSGTTPICDALMCRACAGDEECAAKNDSEPFCVSDGACGACELDSDCPATEPICDDTTHTCRVCVDHAECPSGVCDLNIGECAAAADLIYLDSVDGMNGPMCGDAPDAGACSTFNTVNGALAKVLGARKYVVVSATAYTESIVIDGIEVFIVATGALNNPFFLDDEPALTVSGAADVTIDGLNLQGADGLTNGVGINCLGGSDLRLFNTVVESNELGGLRANNCSVVAESSSFSDNAGVGVNMVNGRLALSASIVEQNDRGGLALEETQFSVENSFIVRNGSTFLIGSGGVLIKSDAIASNMQLFTHNTVTQNETGTGAPGIQCKTTNAVSVTSSIVHGNNPSAIPADADTEGNCSIAFSDVEGLALGVGNNIDMAPVFVDPGATPGNFHLQAGSPGIDAADPNGMTSVDFDGDPRPTGAGPDMGADEVN